MSHSYPLVLWENNNDFKFFLFDYFLGFVRIYLQEHMHTLQLL